LLPALLWCITLTPWSALCQKRALVKNGIVQEGYCANAEK
jgi:hypothetical protein